MIDMYARLVEGGIFLRLAEDRLGLTEFAGTGYTCLYRLFGEQMFVFCLYDILTALLYVHQSALLAVLGLLLVVKRKGGQGLLCRQTKCMYGGMP